MNTINCRKLHELSPVKFMNNCRKVHDLWLLSFPEKRFAIIWPRFSKERALQRQRLMAAWCCRISQCTYVWFLLMESKPIQAINEELHSKLFLFLNRKLGNVSDREKLHSIYRPFPLQQLALCWIKNPFEIH